MRDVEIGGQASSPIRVGAGHPLVWIVGVVGGRDPETLLKTAEPLKKLSEKLAVPLILKASDSEHAGDSGPLGWERLLEGLAWVRAELEVPVLGEVRQVDDLEAASPVLDVIQIPDFLCQHEPLLEAAGALGRPVSVKRGRFASPRAMSHAVRELERTGNQRILLTEAGASFGYETVVGDMTAIPRLRALGYPVALDVTPLGRPLGPRPGTRDPKEPRESVSESLRLLLRSATCAGAAAVCVDTHPNPSELGRASLVPYPLEEMEDLMLEVRDLSSLIRARGYA